MQSGWSRAQSEAVWLLSVGFGAAAAVTAVAPTGHALVDQLLCGMVVALVTWAGSTARTSVVLAASGALGVIALPRPQVAVLALAATVLVAVCDLLGWRRRWVKALGAGTTGLVALHLPAPSMFGGSALVAGLALLAISASGVRHKPTVVRRRTVIAGGAVLLGAVIAAAGTTATVISARHHAEAGEGQIRRAFEAIGDGRAADAAPALDEAVRSFAAAQHALERPWGWFGGVVPVVAQHRALAVDLAASARAAAVTAADAVEEIDVDAVAVEGGRFDPAVVRGLGDAFGAVSDAVDEFRSTLDRRASPWLVPPLRDEVDRVRTRVAVEGDRIANLAAATRVVPGMLGETTPRRYFIAFVTPSEARALGGHMANYAELTIVDGRMELSRFGRVGDLILASADPASRVISGPASYLDRYGRFGAGGDGQPAGPEWWASVTISPDFPGTAQVMAELYEKSTGRGIDGVFAIDPAGLAGLLKVTGPLDVPSTGTRLTADNVVQFLEHDQYSVLVDDSAAVRDDLLGDVAHTTFDRIVDGEPIDPVVLVQSLASPVASGHVMAWSPDPAEQAFFSTVDADGGFARQGLRDGLALTNLNSGGNKIDAFLRRTIRYDAVVDEATGELTGTVEVTLENTAPPSGLTDYVIGNLVGDPVGSNRTYVTLYSAGDTIGMTVDGVPVEPATGTELGWGYSEWRVTVPSGGSTTLRYEVRGTVDPSVPYELLLRAQPVVNPDRVTVTVQSTTGRQLLAHDGVLDGTRVLSAPPPPAET